MTFHEYDKEYLEVSESGSRIVSLGKTSCNELSRHSEGWASGRHKWKIRCFDAQPGYQSVGICTKMKECHAQMLYWESVGTAYSYRGDTGKVYYSGDGSKTILSEVPRWGKGDTVTLLLDCDSHNITFWRNDDLIGTFKVKPKLTYFAALQIDGVKGHDYRYVYE